MAHIVQQPQRTLHSCFSPAIKPVHEPVARRGTMSYSPDTHTSNTHKHIQKSLLSAPFNMTHAHFTAPHRLPTGALASLSLSLPFTLLADIRSRSSTRPPLSAHAPRMCMSKRVELTSASSPGRPGASCTKACRRARWRQRAPARARPGGSRRLWSIWTPTSSRRSRA